MATRSKVKSPSEGRSTSDFGNTAHLRPSRQLIRHRTRLRAPHLLIQQCARAPLTDLATRSRVNSPSVGRPTRENSEATTPEPKENSRILWPLSSAPWMRAAQAGTQGGASMQDLLAAQLSPLDARTTGPRGWCSCYSCYSCCSCYRPSLLQIISAACHPVLCAAQAGMQGYPLVQGPAAF